MAHRIADRIIDDFSQPGPRTRCGTAWELVSDQVMGGVSDGRLTHEPVAGRPAHHLTGTVSLDNNGGFLQMALDLHPDGNAVDASGFAGLAGALMGHYVGTINPNSFDVDLMVYVLTWAIVGGTGTFYGPILGCVVLTVLNEIVLRELGFEQMRPLIYGLIMILSILFLPKGLESIVQHLTTRGRGKAVEKQRAAE